MTTSLRACARSKHPRQSRGLSSALFERYRTRQRLKHAVDDVAVDDFAANSGQAIDHIDIGGVRRQAAVLAGRHVDAYLFILKLARADLIGVGARLDVYPALGAAFFV